MKTESADAREDCANAAQPEEESLDIIRKVRREDRVMSWIFGPLFAISWLFLVMKLDAVGWKGAAILLLVGMLSLGINVLGGIRANRRSISVILHLIARNSRAVSGAQAPRVRDSTSTAPKSDDCGPRDPHPGMQDAPQDR